ncbi:MAG TPA: hypothetical protein VGD56_05530 [Gemmatirosa sp.]
MLLPLLLSAVHAVALADSSVAGTWKLTGDVQGNPVNEVCTLKQAGAAVTGTCTGESGQAYPVTGEIKDGKLTFRHGGEYQGTALTLTYSTPVSSAKAMKGSIDVQPFGVTGDFTAAPAPAAPAAPAPAPSRP